MSTRSRIAVKTKDGKIRSVYCHYDGYNNGEILEEHYDSQEAAEGLIALGDLSYLEAKPAPEPGQAHSWEKPAEGVTVAYHRDRGEPWEVTKPEEAGSEEELIEQGSATDAEYIFLFEDGRWRELVHEAWEEAGNHEALLLAEVPF